MRDIGSKASGMAWGSTRGLMVMCTTASGEITSGMVMRNTPLPRVGNTSKVVKMTCSARKKFISFDFFT